jgi:hypothetical protein
LKRCRLGQAEPVGSFSSVIHRGERPADKTNSTPKRYEFC